jgi:hypothetical protein
MRRKPIIEIISSIFLLVFVYICSKNLLHYTEFKLVLGGAPPFVDHAGVAALAILITVGLVSILLFMPRTRLWGLYGAFALTLLFTFYMAWITWFTPNACPCDGVLKRNLGFSDKMIVLTWMLSAGLAMLGIVLQRKYLRKDKERSKEREMPPVVFT